MSFFKFMFLLFFLLANLVIAELVIEPSTDLENGKPQLESNSDIRIAQSEEMLNPVTTDLPEVGKNSKSIKISSDNLKVYFFLSGLLPILVLCVASLIPSKVNS